MVAREMHTCELEEADAWTWGTGSSISTPEVSFPEAQPTMLRQPWLSGLAACEIVVAISGNNVGRVHNCGSRNTSVVLGHRDWEGCGESVSARFGRQCPWGSLLGTACASWSMVVGAIMDGSQITYKLRCVGQ